MRPDKWDAIAEAFAAGSSVPANGWEAWGEQAAREAVMIRNALPPEVGTLVEVGCGVGRLTPYLAVMFPRIIATDTSISCRAMTRRRCAEHRNVKVVPAGTPPGDAALVWSLYDSDWTPEQIGLHRGLMREIYPLVLEGNAEAYWLDAQLA